MDVLDTSNAVIEEWRVNLSCLGLSRIYCRILHSIHIHPHTCSYQLPQLDASFDSTEDGKSMERDFYYSSESP